jgi:CheY-like chemotaxis protein
LAPTSCFGTLDRKPIEGAKPMEEVAVLPYATALEERPRLQVLVADDDERMRSLLASCVRETGEAITVLEARDGAEAIQLGLQQRPQIAILDVNMPRLDGIAAAITLRGLQPQMRLALQTADPNAHLERARAHRLAVFDKLELDRTLSWLAVQVQACADARLPPGPPQKRSLECSSCRYGVVCSKPPERCPMCQAHDSWIHTPWRPFGRGDWSVVR